MAMLNNQMVYVFVLVDSFYETPMSIFVCYALIIIKSPFFMVSRSI